MGWAVEEMGKVYGGLGGLVEGNAGRLKGVLAEEGAWAKPLGRGRRVVEEEEREGGRWWC